ncbi:3-keto-disaccharide hydrolase [Algisphaera agarilytica]|uniref:3-keto-alpha-glucoside-1,2-lyase/3-keto-2-hydroxy-glucal hydratase domain-containing protein n=1 Tax=Algisphaera agarilytica TaxID=1385975 RepID=A0A7X0H8P9_9BACT|nr:DUF1080 domain-containing protein [Algisphaera agarilytica]MBB6431344.1 hypothetical protein [Algisphaera agarilytica]
MKFSVLVICLAAGSTSYAVAQSAPEAEYESLFDGETLDGWQIMQVPEDHKYFAVDENFFVRDGAIHCYQLPNKNGGLILSERKFGDFELELEFQSDWGCDSGIFLRCTHDGRGIQILNDYLKDGNIGFVFGQGTGGYLSRPILLNEQDGEIVAADSYDGVEIDRLTYAMDAATWNATFKPGEWNTIRIRCVGSEPMITTWLNGVKMMEMDGSVYAGRQLRDSVDHNWEAKPAWDSEKVQQITGNRGSIALQIHPGGRWEPGGSARYRNIRILELDAQSTEQ